jgi:hypothetical protein
MTGDRWWAVIRGVLLTAYWLVIVWIVMGPGYTRAGQVMLSVLGLGVITWLTIWEQRIRERYRDGHR